MLALYFIVFFLYFQYFVIYCFLSKCIRLVGPFSLSQCSSALLRPCVCVIYCLCSFHSSIIYTCRHVHAFSTSYSIEQSIEHGGSLWLVIGIIFAQEEGMLYWPRVTEKLAWSVRARTSYLHLGGDLLMGFLFIQLTNTLIHSVYKWITLRLTFFWRF